MIKWKKSIITHGILLGLGVRWAWTNGEARCAGDLDRGQTSVHRCDSGLPAFSILDIRPWCILVDNSFWVRDIRESWWENMNKTEWCKGRDALPNNAHHLSSNNRIAPIGANTEVKVYRRLFVWNNIKHSHCFLIEVGGSNPVLEKYTDVGRRICFVEQRFIQKRPVYGIDALHKRKRNGHARLADITKTEGTIVFSHLPIPVVKLTV